MSSEFLEGKTRRNAIMPAFKTAQKQLLFKQDFAENTIATVTLDEVTKRLCGKRVHFLDDDENNRIIGQAKAQQYGAICTTYRTLEEFLAGIQVDLASVPHSDALYVIDNFGLETKTSTQPIQLAERIVSYLRNNNVAPQAIYLNTNSATDLPVRSVPVYAGVQVLQSKNDLATARKIRSLEYV